MHASADDLWELRGRDSALGRVFAPFQAFDYGQGSRTSLTSVGCTVPGPRWYEHQYVGATYFSFPGPCRSRRYDQHDDWCVQNELGGECEQPDGSQHCTWHAEPIGEVRLAELSGVESADDEQRMCWQSGTWETDGRQHCFWDGPNDAERNAERAAALDALFMRKYPHIPGDIPPPLCDGSE